MWLTSCLLTALLTLLTWKLVKRGASTFRAETRLIQRQRQQQEEKQQQQAATAVTELQQPLLLGAVDVEDDSGDVVADSDNDSRHHASLSSPLKQVIIQQVENSNQPAAWFDCSCQGDQAWRSAHAADGSATAAADGQLLVLPVPAHLKPLNVASRQQQQEEPGSAVSLSAERQQHLSPPPAAAGLNTSRQTSLLPHHYSSSSSGTGCCCCLRCFTCFNPHKLDLSTVTAFERQQLPWQPLLLLFFLSCWVVISDTAKVTLQCGSLTYWVVALSVVPPAAAVTLLVRQWLLTKTAVKSAAADMYPAYEALTPPRAAAGGAGGRSERSRGVPSSVDIHWTPRNSLLYPVLCSVAGVVAGLFGVGGGIVKGPLMLELGVCPEVSRAGCKMLGLGDTASPPCNLVTAHTSYCCSH